MTRRVPDDLQVMYKARDGKVRTLYFDRQYNETLGLLHEDAHRDSAALEVPGVLLPGAVPVARTPPPVGPLRHRCHAGPHFLCRFGPALPF